MVRKPSTCRKCCSYEIRFCSKQHHLGPPKIDRVTPIIPPSPESAEFKTKKPNSADEHRMCRIWLRIWAAPRAGTMVPGLWSDRGAERRRGTNSADSRGICRIWKPETKFCRSRQNLQNLKQKKTNSADQDRICRIWNATSANHPNQILQIKTESAEFGPPKMCRIWAGSPATQQNLQNFRVIPRIDPNARPRLPMLGVGRGGVVTLFW